MPCLTTQVWSFFLIFYIENLRNNKIALLFPLIKKGIFILGMTQKNPMTNKLQKIGGIPLSYVYGLVILVHRSGAGTQH